MDDLFIRALTIDWARVAADSYVRGIGALRELSRLDFDRPVTLLCGENGSGKSTLLEALAVSAGFNAEGGTMNYRFSTYDDASDLAGALSLVRGHRRPRAGYFLRAESFFNVATVTSREYDDGTLPDYHAESHGESFLTFMRRAGGPGLFLMDEPEAALSPQRQLSLIRDIALRTRAGSQFVIATHSPIVLGVPDARILAFGPDGVAPCAYEETSSFQLTKLFIENREGLLRRLMEDD